MSEDRHSKADAVELIKDPDEKARREAENGIRQFKAALEIIRINILNPSKRFRLNQSVILTLHQKALEGIHSLAGTYRNTRGRLRKPREASCVEVVSGQGAREVGIAEAAGVLER